MEQNFILPMYSSSEDVCLPTITYKTRIYDSYGKSLFDYLSQGQYFIMLFAKNNLALDDVDINNLSETMIDFQPGASVCKIDKIKKNSASYSIEFTAIKGCFVSGFRSMENSNIVLGSAIAIDDNTVDEFMLLPFINDIKIRYKELSKKMKSLPNFPSDKMLKSHEPSFYIANFLNLAPSVKYDLLIQKDATKRLQIVYKAMSSLDKDSQIDAVINAKVEKAIEKNQKEYILREKMKAIKDELKPYDGPSDEDRYNEVMNSDDTKYPEKIRNRVKDEFSRMQAMPGGSQEYAVIKTYLDLLIKMPWFKSTTDNSNMKEVKKILDNDHYGLIKQKQRIAEYLAVKSLTNSLKSPILCLYGPPGTGKTSLAISIARALGRKFCKISLGGISDESEIRGHRKTYVGAMPGKIISSLAKVGVNNPVILLDEIDKLKDGGYHGDPASALLEVLDPEQNVNFQDNYLEETFDLSNVLFICTANNIGDIPAPLRDRLELIELNTYTNIEKYHIAKSHLIPLELEANGLKEHNITFTDEAIYYIIENYTREAGVRSLRRNIGSIMRKFAVEFLSNNETVETAHVDIDIKAVEKYLNKPIFVHTKVTKGDQIGVVNGLAYTDFGGAYWGKLL